MIALKISSLRMCNLLVAFTIIIISGCSRNGGSIKQPEFEAIPQKKLLQPIVNEISGIADARSVNGVIWGIEDSGNPPHLYAIGHDGQLKKTIYLKGITNRDWEDLTLSGNRLFIAETGDNALQQSEYIIYAMNEPSVLADTVSEIDKIRFVYADGAHDCEALLVDPASGDIYLFTKTSSGTGVYRLVYPFSTSSVQTASFVGKINYNSVVSISQTADGKEIILKTYTTLFHFYREPGEGIFQALSKSPHTLPYEFEPQGEAVSFAQDNSGYFTLSEKAFSSVVNLCFYKRK